MVLSVQYPPNFSHFEILDRGNQLLNLLSDSELRNLLANSERVVFPAQTTLCKPDEGIRKVYFPLRGIISMANVCESGSMAEVATVSNEGMIDIYAFLGNKSHSNFAIAQTECIAIAIPVDILRQEFTYSKELQRILLLYAQALFAQVSQNVFCSCHHTLEQRLSRWLLAYSDRLETKKLLLTQETLADSIGVRRSSLSVVAVDLRQRKLIDYNRGKITILDSEALERMACSCDRVISDDYTQILN